MPNLHYLLGKVRQLTGEFKTGDFKSVSAFYELISLLLHRTIAKKSATIRIYPPKDKSGTYVIGGSPEPRTPIPLNNGHYLRLTVSLFFEEERLRVKKSSYQYQLDPERTPRWIFRYDYARAPVLAYPPSHLQVNGILQESSLISLACPDIHFPVNRISLEAVIRLLVEQFKIKCNEPKYWRKVLAESERLFYDIAFRPLSGPEE